MKNKKRIRIAKLMGIFAVIISMEGTVFAAEAEMIMENNPVVKEDEPIENEVVDEEKDNEMDNSNNSTEDKEEDEPGNADSDEDGADNTDSDERDAGEDETGNEDAGADADINGGTDSNTGNNEEDEIPMEEVGKIQAEFEEIENEDLDTEKEKQENDFPGKIEGNTLIVNIADLAGDNSTKIQDALNMANPAVAYQSDGTGLEDEYVEIKNMKVIIPSGTYNLSVALELFADTEFELADDAVIVATAGRTFIQGEYSTSVRGGSWVVNQNRMADGNIKKLSIMGSKFTSESSSELIINGNEEITISDCEFNNVSLKLEEGEGDAVVTGNFIIADGKPDISGETIQNGGGGFGIYIDSQYSNIEVINNKIYNVSGTGILVKGNGSKILNNVITGCSTGIQTMNAGSLSINGNQIMSSALYGIMVENADTVDVISNKIDGGSQQGINVSQSLHVNLNGNEMKNIGNHGILISNNTKDARVENNTTQSCAIGMYLEVPDASVKDNNVAASKIAGILCMNASGVALDHNIVSNTEQNGFHVENCANAVIKNNQSRGNGMNGIVVLKSENSSLNDNTLESNKLEGLHLETSDNSLIKNNLASGNASNGYGITKSSNIVIESNLTNSNGHFGIIVTGNGGSGNVVNNSKAVIRSNKVSNDALSGIEVTGATAIIDNNTVTGSGSAGGEGIVAVYSADTWIMNNKVSGIKSAQPGIIGNGIIVADQSKKCYIYKNTVENCGNHGIQVTYGATDITTLGNSVSGNGNQGITYSRKASGIMAGNQVLNSGNHNIINEDANVKVGGNYVSGGGKAESIAFNSGCTGTAKGNIIVGTKYKLFINASSIVEQDNKILASAPETNPYKEVGNIENFVKRLYNKVLKRNAEDAGLADWTSYLLCREMTGAEAASGFFLSNEYIAKNVSNEELVDTLYDAMFDSKGDAEGRKFWLNDLETGFSRTYLMWGFAESSQFDNLCNRYGITRGTVTLTEPRDQNRGVTQFVSRIYKEALHRGVDTHGLNTWCDEILSGRETPAQVVSGFIFSTEFINRNLSDEEFIKVMYATYFDRDADPTGMETWMDVLKKNPDRSNVVNGFNGSQEFFDLVSRFGL